MDLTIRSLFKCFSVEQDFFICYIYHEIRAAVPFVSTKGKKLLVLGISNLENRCAHFNIANMNTRTYVKKNMCDSTLKKCTNVAIKIDKMKMRRRNPF